MTSNGAAAVSRALSVLDSWDFSPIRQRLTGLGTYVADKVGLVEVEYKRFIAICVAYATPKNPTVISAQVDEYWHAHVLFTRNYREMSKAMGFEYLDHEPASDADSAKLELGYLRTMELYRRHFGEPNKEFWPEYAQICGGSGCSCSGTGNIGNDAPNFPVT
jgi:hypothetical protein